MEYTTLFRTENDLLPNLSSSNKYLLGLNNVDFFAKKFIDLSDVSFLNIAESLSYYSIFYDGSSIFTGTEETRNYGIYFAAIN